MLLRCALLLALALLGTRDAGADIVVSAPPTHEADAARVRALDLERLDAALTRAGLTRPDTIAVLLVPDADPRTRDVPSWIVGLAYGPGDIVLFPDRVLAYPYDSLESVVRHEVAHLALTTRANGEALPRWFHEGVAISVDAGWDLSSRVQLLLAMLTRPTVAQLGRLFQSPNEIDTRQAYLLSAVLVEDLRERHGADIPGVIAARVGNGVPFPQAFENVTGETPDAAADRAWDRYRRWTAWIPALTSASAAWALILVLAFVAYLVQIRRRVLRRRRWDEEDEPELDG